MAFTELTEFDFHQRLAGLSGTSIVLFSGPHCGACKRLETQLPKWLSGHADHFFKVDAQRSTALARAFEVFHLPALFVYVNGHYHAPLQAEAAPAPLIAALLKLLGEPAHEEP